MSQMHAEVCGKHLTNTMKGHAITDFKIAVIAEIW